jgi:Tfp pilus assembly protein PilZ
MDANKHLKSRKDARLIFNKNQKVAVRCLTSTCRFEARIRNVSSSGIFIQTQQELPVGEEIAVSFTFPNSGNRVKATGKVVRTTYAGMGIEIQVYFKENLEACEIRKTARKKQPSLIFLGSSNPSK